MATKTHDTDLIKRLYEAGETYKEIGIAADCSMGTIAKVVKEAGLPPRGKKNGAAKPAAACPVETAPLLGDRAPAALERIADACDRAEKAPDRAPTAEHAGLTVGDIMDGKIGPWEGVPEDQWAACAVTGCTRGGRAHHCFYDGERHHHGCIHYDCEAAKADKHGLTFRPGWGLICDEHYKILSEAHRLRLIQAAAEGKKSACASSPAVASKGVKEDDMSKKKGSKKAAAKKEPKAKKAPKARAPRAPRKDKRLPAVGTTIKKFDREGKVRASCTVTDGGGIRYKGKDYSSISSAAKAAMRDLGLTAKQVNGYVWWGIAK